MAKERVIPIQFQKPLIDEIEMYVKKGFYSSKAEFVREAVRRLIIELRRQLFWNDMATLKTKAKQKGAKNKIHLSKKAKEKLFEELKKRT